MIDLRNFAAKLDLPVGIGHGNAYNASYPYIIQANYRAGYFTHYAGEGTLCSCKVKLGEEVVDLALERTMATYKKDGLDTVLTTDPFVVKFSKGEIKMQSIFTFKHDSGEIEFKRVILENPNQLEVVIENYICGCYGTNEYSEDMTGISLEVNGKTKEKIDYLYKGRHIESENGEAIAHVPQINSKLSMSSKEGVARCEEGIAFSPMYRLSCYQKKSKGEFVSWLKVEKEN